MSESEYETMPVRLVGPMPEPRQRRYRTTFTVYTLTPDNPVERILPESSERIAALIQPHDDDVRIAGKSGDVTSGAIIPKANNQPYPIQENGAVWVIAPTMAGATSRVSVTATYCTLE